MNLKIDDHTLQRTTECNKDLACLNDDEHPICKVKFYVGKEFSLIKCLHTEYCFYQTSFGYSFVCKCPVRNEIYKRYEY